MYLLIKLHNLRLFHHCWHDIIAAQPHHSHCVTVSDFEGCHWLTAGMAAITLQHPLPCGFSFACDSEKVTNDSSKYVLFYLVNYIVITNNNMLAAYIGQIAVCCVW